MPEGSSSNKYYLLDLERTGPLLVWWKPNAQGYTINLAEAGVYEEDAAQRHVRQDDQSHTVAVWTVLAHRFISFVVDADHRRELLQAIDAEEPS